MDVSKKDFALATMKGVVSEVPIIGGCLSEYIGLAQRNIADKRLIEWQNMVEVKLEKLDCDMKTLSENDFFYSCVQLATSGALKTHQKEKRAYFAEALYNSHDLPDILEEKKLIFLSMLDRYSPLAIKLLGYYSKDNFYEENKYDTGNMVKTRTIIPGTEKPMEGIVESIPELSYEPDLTVTLTTQLTADGLIESINLAIPVVPKEARKKRTTSLGDEFMRFITDKG